MNNSKAVPLIFNQDGTKIILEQTIEGNRITLSAAPVPVGNDKNPAEVCAWAVGVLTGIDHMNPDNLKLALSVNLPDDDGSDNILHYYAIAMSDDIALPKGQTWADLSKLPRSRSDYEDNGMLRLALHSARRKLGFDVDVAPAITMEGNGGEGNA